MMALALGVALVAVFLILLAAVVAINRRDARIGSLVLQLEGQRRKADKAEKDRREALRLLVILSEPLKDWDLDDFAWEGARGHTHRQEIQRAYRVTAGAVAPLRAGMKLHDRAHSQGWDDQPLPRQRRSHTDGTPYPDGDPFP